MHSHTLSLSSQISLNYVACRLYLLAGAEGLSTRAAVRHTSTKDITKHGRPTQGTTLQSTPPTKICGPWFVEPATLEPLKYHVYTRCMCHFTALRSALSMWRSLNSEGRGLGPMVFIIRSQEEASTFPVSAVCPARLSNTATFCKTNQAEDVVSILQLRWRVPSLLKTLVLKQITPTHSSPHPSLPLIS